MADQLSKSKNAVRGAIANKADLAEGIGFELASLPPAAFDEFAKWISAYAMRQQPLIKTVPVKTFKELNSVGCVLAPELERQLSWALSIVKLHERAIGAFVALADQFEAHWLANDADAALATLDQIESVCGKSLWAIECRIAVLHQAKGLEAQKTFVSEVSRAAQGSIGGFLAFYISIRNEDATSLSRFVSRTSAIINRQRVNDPAKAYLRSIITNEHPAKREDLRDVLAYASSISLIDLFCALRRALNCAATDAELKASWPTILSVAQVLVQIDTALSPYVELFEGKISRDGTPSPAADAYWEGDYDLALTLAAAQLETDPSDAFNLWLMAAAIGLGGNRVLVANVPNVFRVVVDPLTKLFLRQGGIAQAVGDITKVLCNCRMLRAARCLEGYYARDWIDASLVDVSRATAAFTESRLLRIDHALVVPVPVGRDIVRACARDNGRTASVIRTLVVEDAAALPGASAAKFLEARAVGELWRGNDSASLSTATEIMASGHQPWNRRASGLILGALLDAGEFASALDRVVDYASEEDDLRFTLPLRRMFAGKRWRDLARWRGELSLPTALEVHQRTTADNEQLSTLRTAYDEFLKSQGVERPSQLVRDRFPPNRLRQFFYKVCVPEVMDVSFQTFRSSRDVTDERIKVCGILAEMTPDGAEIYEEEIRELTKAQKLQDALRDVDRTRVHVNVDGIRRVCLSKLRRHSTDIMSC